MRQTNKYYPTITDQSMVYRCQYHVIRCPKYRRKVLTELVAARMKELVLEKLDEYGYTVIEMDVMLDHVHLLLDVDPREGVTVVGTIKGFTSHELRNECPKLKQQLPTCWTRSTFLSTVRVVTLDSVQHYIEDQKGV